MAWSHLALAVLAIVSLFIAGRLYALYKNYVIARKIGFPIVIALESWQDPLWVIGGPYIKNLFFKLGIWDRKTPDLSTFGFPIFDRYNLHKKHGPAFSLVTPFKTNIFVADSEATRTLFKDWRIWVKNQELYDMMNGFGRNVNTVNGDDWQRHRKVTAVAFKEANSKLVWKASLKQAEGLGKRFLAESQKGKENGVDLAELREGGDLVAMHVLSSAAMGKDQEFEHGLEEIQPGHKISYSKAMKIVIDNVSPMLVPLTMAATKLPPAVVPNWLRKLQIAVEEVRWDFEDAIARERKAYHSGEKEKDNLLSILVRANEAERTQDSGRKWSLNDEELFGNLYMFHQAGHETTSSTMSYAIMFLVAYPEIQAWVREEVDAVLGGTDLEDAYTEAYPRLVRCEALMYETLRFFSAIPFHPKYTGNTAQVLKVDGKDYVIPAHTFVSVNYYGMHFNPKTWGPDVDTYNPKRFIKTSPQGAGSETFLGAPGDAEFVGWSFGPRVCPGKKFSQVEFVTVMASLLKRYEFTLAKHKGESTNEARQRLTRTMFDVDHFISVKVLHPHDAGVLCVERKR